VGRRILLIEDSPIICRLVEICLRGPGTELVTRLDGLSGLEAVTAEAPDLVVLDIAIPELDGWQVLDAIRSNPATADLPVIVLTAHAAEETRGRANKSGANAFLSKPFVPQDLRQWVDTLIGGSDGLLSAR